MGKKSVFWIFSGKIFIEALSPLFDPPKNPYIRGDTGRGEGVIRPPTYLYLHL
jgi:hypothetical protein